MYNSSDPIKFKSRKEARAALKSWRNRSFETVVADKGIRMPDDSIYAGFSPDTGKPIYALPQDACVTMTFNQAADYVAELNKNNILGHGDWRLPTIKELEILFRLQYKDALNGTFNHHARRPYNSSSLYWSSSLSDKGTNNAYCLRFNGTGIPQSYYRDGALSVRCIR